MRQGDGQRTQAGVAYGEEGPEPQEPPGISRRWHRWGSGGGVGQAKRPQMRPEGCGPGGEVARAPCRGPWFSHPVSLTGQSTVTGHSEAGNGPKVTVALGT